MDFIADLHIHSRFSLATSRQLNVPHLVFWAARKGINVLGCGDFTHPKWREELKRDLCLDEESGLYQCRPEVIKSIGQRGGVSPAFNAPLFCLQAEISSIYKKNGKVRKVHNLVFAPDFEVADEISRRLALIGNINSDGRPILGLDSHDLLEIILECSPDAVLIPAHIWTPWFALFGSRSGFDRIEDCYGDLTSHIFALETGLSSDPAMNRCLSALDNYALVSNSDAHSGANLGREANLFRGSPSYAGMFAALRAAARRVEPAPGECRLLGTMEFYPEEGKYHLDGHRSCNVVLSPAESRELGNICPVCGKPLTIGVLHRVMELADRDEPGQPPNEPEARMLVPLAEVIGEIMAVGATSRKATEKYDRVITGLGSELDVLCRLPEDKIRAFWEPLGEAMARLRAGNVILEPGFDGQYGKIRIFRPEERAELRGGKTRGVLLSPLSQTATGGAPRLRKLARFGPKSEVSASPPQKPFILSPAQMAAVRAGSEPTFILAGPGAGKTRVLVERILALLASGVNPAHILAITFTRRAAGEMQERLATGLAASATLPRCDTLHALAWALLNEQSDCEREALKQVVLGEDAAQRLFRDANAGLPAREIDRLWHLLNLAREKNHEPDPDVALAKARYAALKGALYLDYGDLLAWLLANAASFKGKWKYILVDEAQDLSPIQLAIVRALLPADGSGFFGIGDPDQSIYEFRGASGDCVANFQAFWPQTRIIRLNESYRASQAILDMAHGVLGEGSRCGAMRAQRGIIPELKIFRARDGRQEAQWLARQIKNLLGATAHTLLDAAANTGLDNALAPGDIAVLVRLKAQLPPIIQALEQVGVPWAAPAVEEFWRDDQCRAFLEIARASPDSPPPATLLEILANDPANPLDPAILARTRAFAALRRLWERHRNWESFFQELAWLQEAEMIAARAQCVRLATIHASKGLEFQAVFLPGLEDGLLPLKREALFGRQDWATENPEAEKRLLYVGLTRAARAIYISYCQDRTLYGKHLRQSPSPYLALVESFCRKTELVLHHHYHAESLNLFGGGNSARGKK